MHFQGVAGFRRHSLSLGQPLPLLTGCWLLFLLATCLFPQFVSSLDGCWAIEWYDVFVDKLQHIQTLAPS